MVSKYNIKFKGILHVGAHECEEISIYNQYLDNNNILWIEAMADKVEICRRRFPAILIEHAVVSDKIENVVFNVSNNGQSSSMLELGTHKIYHPDIHYVSSFSIQTSLLSDILDKYSELSFNFLNMDIQGAELKALKGMGKYLEKLDYIYLEINEDYVYENCSLVSEIDAYLGQLNFVRKETAWWTNATWGEAFYIKTVTN